MDVQSTVKHYIVTELMHEQDPNVLDSEVPLIEGGIIDSMSLIRLVQFIQGKFGIKVGEDELDIDNFRTVSALTGFINNKMNAAK